ncbi:hypothetical protein QTH91_04945 [Variovorax dokdonensis]|uniref:Uncharacterized protein n=1 Tax=Variovorax dokdonensis TaxID=344883 RepID=A0ABT7N7A4_9BURK|nr:hypothetical protein [Variovorax dokdonensis]MDM0043823.1 hypothetical protein [Variovorax dokdonensis]
MSQDHQIALMVDEPIPGHFYWMLLRHEDAEHHPQVVDCAPGPLPGYAPAMMAGIAALQRRVDAKAEGGGVPVVAAFIAPADEQRGRPRHH